MYSSPNLSASFGSSRCRIQADMRATTKAENRNAMVIEPVYMPIPIMPIALSRKTPHFKGMVKIKARALNELRL